MKGPSGKILLAVLVVAVGAWAFRDFFSDERLIRKRLGEIEQYLDKPEGEGDLIGANKVRKLGELFTPQFEISVPQYGVAVSDRGELMRVALLYRTRARAITATFSGVELSVQGHTATAEAIATLNGRDGTNIQRESYRVAIDWTKDDQHGWLLRRLEVLEVLEGSPLF